jgi:single-stranded-DNA-specific exonuclease
LCTSEVTLCEPPKKIGGGERHLSLRLAQHGVELRAVAFGGGEWADALAEIDGPIAVAFQPFVNHFRGRKSVELQVRDWQPAAVLAASGSCA